MSQEPSEPQEINWEEIKQRFKDIIKEHFIDNGKDFTDNDLELESAHTNNFNQYFVKNEKGEVLIDVKEGVENGYVKRFSDEENDQRMMKQWVDEANPKSMRAKMIGKIKDPLEPA